MTTHSTITPTLEHIYNYNIENTDKVLILTEMDAVWLANILYSHSHTSNDNESRRAADRINSKLLKK